MGTFNCCKCVVPHMITNNYGRIVNVASVAGKDGNANASAYSSAKAGAIGLTKSLGKELADKNIAVNAVTPAGAKTRILDQMSKEHVARMLSKVPRGRFLEIEEFTSLICWLHLKKTHFQRLLSLILVVVDLLTKCCFKYSHISFIIFRDDRC